MIDQDLAIEPPPTLEAILSHRERIGRVDFTHRLVATPPAEQEADAEAARDSGSDAETEHVHAVETPAAGPNARADDADAGATPPVEQPTHPQPGAEAAMPGAPAREALVEHTRVEQDGVEHLVAPPLLDSPASRTGEEASAQVAAQLSLVPAEDMETVTEDVSEVVAGVLARIREVQSATLAHLEAIEVEAALRCEMLTAQAELDAELIRLHARREAHAIIAAARARSGMPGTGADDVRRLDHLAASASHFSESLEELGPQPGSPDHPFLP